ncbi:MAG: ABC transporter ATP-binding protein/permease [Magnetococcus sp. DMHC-6]
MRPVLTAHTDETRYGHFLDIRLMVRLFHYVQPHRKWLWLALLLLPIGILAQVAQPWMIQRAVDHHLATGQMAGFGFVLLVLGGMAVLQMGVGYTQSTLHALLGQRMVRDLRMALFDHLVHQEAAFFHQNNNNQKNQNQSGQLTNRLTNDIEAVSQMVSAGLIGLLGDFLLLLGITFSMFLLSAHLSLVIVVMLPIILLTSGFVTQRMRLLQRRSRQLQSSMAGRLTEEIEGYQVVRLFQRQQKNRFLFDEDNRNYLQTSLKSNKLEAFQFSFVEAASHITIALLFLYAAIPSIRQAVTVGILVAFIDYIRRFFFPIRDIANKYSTMQAAMTALERIFSLLDSPTTLVDPPTPLPISELEKGRVSFEQVTFGYGQETILKGITLDIQPGEHVAIVGPTGAGKSSLIKLINRTFDVHSGQVLVHGTDVRHLALPQLRRLVGVVWQETFLFAGTIADNIGLMDPAITPERIRWAVAQTGADTFINALPQGLETQLAERAADLSTGQRQLLGLARVLAFDPVILILDEATSSIDAISEQYIQRALQTILATRTALLIAHRLSTIQHADRIIVLSNGQIVEQGTHDDLLQQNGLYAQLYALQLRGQTLGDESPRPPLFFKN